MSLYESYVDIPLPWLSQMPSHWALLRNKNFLKEVKETVGDASADYTLLSLTTKGIIPRDVASGKGKFPKDYDTYKVVTSGDIAFCLFDIDETPRTVGLSEYDGMLTGAYTVFNLSGINPHFFTYYYLALDNAKALRPLYSGLRKTIKTNVFLGTKLPVPPRKEQDQIVRYLDWQVSKTNKLIHALKKQIALLKEQKQAVINEAVTKCGEGWQRKPLKYWVKSNVSSLSSNTSPDFEIDYLDISSVGHGYIKQEPVHLSFLGAPSRARRIVKYGDTIISTVRTYLRSVCFIDGDYENCIVSTGFSVLSPNESAVLPELLSFVLSSDDFIDNVIKNSVGVSYPAISDSKLLALKISLPVDLDEQQNIYQAIKKNIRVFDSLMTKINNEIALLAEYRTRLISDVVTGQIDVRDIEVPDFEYVTDETDDASDDENVEEMVDEEA